MHNVRNKLTHKGFTLIELIIVISIISLLTTLGAGSYSSVLRSARDTKRMADLAEIVKAVKMFQIDHGRGPAESGWCQTSIGNDPGPCPPTAPTYQWLQNQTWTDLVTGGYLERLPVDPRNDLSHYYYYEPNNPGTWTLKEDGTTWFCPASTASGNCGGWIETYLESGDVYRIYWDAP